VEQTEHAVVLGASIAGLLAARVLADRYRWVTVVERDVLPALGEHRRGVPHGRHLHALQPRGLLVLEDLFEGFTRDLVAAGALTGDALANVRYQFSGHRIRQANAGVEGLFASRPLLEGHLRARVTALPNVRICQNTEVISPTTSAARVTGVRVMSRAPGQAGRTMTADLVVDATGRGSRTPLWLDRLGYQRPEVEQVGIDLSYASRVYRLRPGALGTDRLVVTGPARGVPRRGVLAAMEDGRHIVTLVGQLGERPPTDAAGFEAYAGRLAFPDIAEALHGAEPLEDAVPFRFPASVRQRYERLRRFPAGLLVIGDAVCSFNPVYGQGMTVAAIQAAALRDLLAAGGAPPPASWFRTIAPVVDASWQAATGADLANPAVPGRRTARTRLAAAYLPRVHAAAARDVALGRALVRVTSMVNRPQGLLRPDRAARVLLAALRRTPAGAGTTAPTPEMADRAAGG
jgi:2-polyprenyl-6-methoxyphenol hydroxylase-like FAD-dependent oxidoreductase